MSTWSARYVRLRDRDRDVARLRSHADVDAGAEMHVDGKSSFAVWLVPSPKFEPVDLARLGGDFSEVIALAVQTVADLVVYDHFVGATRMRGLTYAGEAGWVRVQGEAEPWEGTLLFAPSKLAELREELEDEYSGDVLAREQSELELLFKLGKLQEGSTRPAPEPLAFARAIEKQFGLPARPQK
ncbi:MAG TPA: hypothetical protein VIF09_14600 [Polyangiaceae bacterium]|jgi:hypothetical protein